MGNNFGAEYISSHHYLNTRTFLDEIARISPNRFTSRALFGVYAQWFYEQTIHNLPKNVTVTFINQEVLNIERLSNASFQIKLSENAIYDVNQVVMALGHVEQQAPEVEQHLAAAAEQHGLTYLPANHPADANLDALEANQPVIMRGLGLSFFDYIAQLSTGRGGRFTRGTDSGLIYHPSGHEPKIIAGSRSGIPMHARGVNQKYGGHRYEPKFFTRSALDQYAAAHQHKISFNFFFNLVKKEMAYKHYLNVLNDLAITWPFNAADFLAALANSDDLNATARQFGLPEDMLMDWQHIFNPIPVVQSTADYQDAMLNYLNWDIHDARLGNDDAPYAGAFDILRDVRGIIRHYLQAGYLSADDYAQFLKTFNPFNSIVSVGPPALRVEQMRALIKAGILTLTGPKIQVTIQDDHFLATDTLGGTYVASQLVEARLQSINVASTNDHLVQHLYQKGWLSNESYQQSDATTYTVGGARMNQETLTVLDQNKHEIPGLFIWGVPTEGWSWFTTFAPRPKMNDKIFRDAENITNTIFPAIDA
ncbi:FAD/NAD(P)-binding protein [Weissella diestrammenae]|uniref:FAD/NAD(P)-binding protein n=1 Tax=Weissella diestrammenae TaxID=1162633 RepID=UPI001FABC9C4|nr:FAD/NAD(P)-binding protein [Weissella diestrammenae]